MADNVLIEPLVLDPADFPPLPLQPGFLDLVSSEVDDQGTPTDGFDDIVGEVIAIVDALEAGLAGLNPTLEDTFAEADTIDAAPVSDTVDGFTGSLTAPSSAADDLGTLLSGATPPTPPGSGSTGGGGGRPATCGILDMGSAPFSVAGQANFHTVTVVLTNNTTRPLTVKSTTWTPAQTFGFRVLPSIAGAVIQPGATLAINIVAGNGGVGTTRATLTVNTDGPDPQPCLNVTAEWLPAAGFSGGSPITNCVHCADWACLPG